MKEKITEAYKALKEIKNADGLAVCDALRIIQSVLYDLQEKKELTHEEALEIYESLQDNRQMTVKEMREYLGITKVAFSRKYGIPPRTLDSWESGERTPAPYILKLLQRAVQEDK